MSEENKQKFGQGHLKGFIRQGHKELAQVLPAFPSSPVQPIEEPGLVGNLTPQEVVKGKGHLSGYQSTRDASSSQSTDQQRPAPER